jgi:fluoroquinolone resistance protein
MNKLNYRSRWDQPLLVKTNNELARLAKSKRTLLTSPFGLTEEGRMDYRGFTLAVPVLYSVISNADLTLLRCDWAGCLTDCVVTDSIFEGAGFDGRFLTKRFEICDFTNISLKNSPLGDSSYSKCRFTGANFSAALARGAIFSHCSFAKVNFKSAVMQKCTFENCDFEGAKFQSSSFVGSKFKDCLLDRASLEDAMLDNTTFE